MLCFSFVLGGFFCVVGAFFLRETHFVFFACFRDLLSFRGFAARHEVTQGVSKSEGLAIRFISRRKNAPTKPCGNRVKIPVIKKKKIFR